MGTLDIVVELTEKHGLTDAQAEKLASFVIDMGLDNVDAAALAVQELCAELSPEAADDLRDDLRLFAIDQIKQALTVIEQAVAELETAGRYRNN